MADKLKPKSITGNLSAAGLRFGIVISRFNSFITERLLAGALDALERAGAADNQVEIVRVPGSFELPRSSEKAGRRAPPRRDHLHRLRSARRNFALRACLERSRARHSTRADGYGRAHGVLRSYLRDARTGHRSRGLEERQQRLRSRPRRSRNGKSLSPASRCRSCTLALHCCTKIASLAAALE